MGKSLNRQVRRERRSHDQVRVPEGRIALPQTFDPIIFHGEENAEYPFPWPFRRDGSRHGKKKLKTYKSNKTKTHLSDGKNRYGGREDELGLGNTGVNLAIGNPFHR